MRVVLTIITAASLAVLVLVWWAAPWYFATKSDETTRSRVLHVFKTSFPEPWLLIVIPAYVVVLALIPGAVWHSVQFWNPALATAGTACVVLSVALMCWARWTLGTMWAARPLVQDHHELCTSGPYRFVRHPIYTGLLGIIVGVTPLAGFGSLLAACLFLFVFVYIRVRREDRMMIRTFGERYETYRRQVPAVIPFTRWRRV
ncbi:protein-S-isoprenylcysteine O-methyltransferase [Fodinicola feengrottensis]|uniref:Protein-S-isoprenylcysteine O-methyltransferase n=1 Tax=Fodinicola feengrottensis TaxID=435914 RepID=A0ABN2GI30_9ACTN